VIFHCYVSSPEGISFWVFLHSQFFLCDQCLNQAINWWLYGVILFNIESEGTIINHHGNFRFQSTRLSHIMSTSGLSHVIIIYIYMVVYWLICMYTYIYAHFIHIIYIYIYKHDIYIIYIWYIYISIYINKNDTHMIYIYIIYIWLIW
jgi:hypothetical protein